MLFKLLVIAILLLILISLFSGLVFLVKDDSSSTQDGEGTDPAHRPFRRTVRPPLAGNEHRVDQPARRLLARSVLRARLAIANEDRGRCV